MKTGNDQLPLVGVDTGGTFTDLVLVHGPVIRTWKLPSTPADPSQAVLEGLRQLCDAGPALVFHGSTVATNALLEGKGADVALVTTAGFRDLLELGRQNRPNLYQLQPRKRPSLVPNNKVIEVKERCLPDGQVECPLTEEELKRVVEDVLGTGCSAVAICLLHAYANPNHEAALAAALSSAGVNVSASHRVLNEFREFERASTTVINAKVSPVMDGYLKRLAIGLSGRPLRIMQSNGGAISPSVAGQEAVRTILSGPAGGLVGAFGAAQRAGLTKVITFDMGGTSTDVALCDGGLTRTTETEIAGWPLKIPM
ncbi:MAG: hydantoinase/oxoprolinase family protein, partial [Deltaproteobacteria bacterium]|nr:hydantoinase/oxoprolinase family protein [Deltaproteobacteria bacterium]